MMAWAACLCPIHAFRVPVLAHSSLNTPVYNVLCPRAANLHGGLSISFCILVSQENHNVACRGLSAHLSYSRSEMWQSEHTCSQDYCVHCCHVMEVWVVTTYDYWGAWTCLLTPKHVPVTWALQFIPLHVPLVPLGHLSMPI